ncbi:hypothetical protein [Streptosporangium sp. NPDC051022]|uniref:hypothetical protein n=1 Tax=Streptosporangium sp. NPDC051022 TaxID=3155752 RepID=UPI003437BF18
MLILMFAAVVTGLVLLIRRAARPSELSLPFVPLELQEQAHALVERGQRAMAVELVHERTGLGITAARRYVDDLAAGMISRTPHPGGTSAGLPHGGVPDLAARVRDLKASGRAEQAVLLVRGETGMAEADAWRFVDSIR